jgi:hypothetical protein
VREFFGEYEYRHHKSGRLVKEEIFPMHYLAFPEGASMPRTSAATSRTS